MKSLVLGRGEIGKAVAKVIKQNDTVDTYDIEDGPPPEIAGIDILHVCYPYVEEDGFIASVRFYISKYKPEHLIIWSTVPIGTTKQIRGAVHSPVEGKHPELEKSIRSMVRWIGSKDWGERKFFEDYFKKLFMRVKGVRNSDWTEFLKLRSTAKYGVNLVWADYEAKVAKELKMDFRHIQDFDIDYNKLYHNLGMTWAKRYILQAPNGKIGGHCICPNAELLDKQFPSELLKMIKEMK